MTKFLYAAMAVCILAMPVSIVFPGGYMPHQVEVGNGETAIAYRNGVVYTSGDGCAGGIFNKCTLSQNSDGSVIQTFDIIMPLGYMRAQLPATPRLAAKWRQAQEALSPKS